MKDTYFDALRLGGKFVIEHVRDGKVIDCEEVSNLVVNEGLEYALGTSLNSVAQITTWYVGIFEGNYTPLNTDTAATIAANSTECTAYDEATRQSYTPVQTTTSITNNASRAEFTMNDTKTVYGAFIVSSATKSGGAGKLWAAAKFSAAKNVVAADVLRVRYDCAVAAS